MFYNATMAPYVAAAVKFWANTTSVCANVAISRGQNKGRVM